MFFLRFFPAHSFALYSRLLPCPNIIELNPKPMAQTLDPCPRPWVVLRPLAKALLQGEDIDCFSVDVNMSILEGGIGIFPRRLMVRSDDLDAARLVMRDNEIDLGF
jgi:hypothetical protein